MSTPVDVPTARTQLEAGAPLATPNTVIETDSLTEVQSAVRSAGHRPPLASHRLIGQGRGAALLRPTGEVDWWCPNRFDATPMLWSLLDPDGGAAAWLDVELATWDGRPAGPTTRTVLRRGTDRVETWDGLLQLGTGTALIRLVRALGSPGTLSHRLRCGGFGDDPTRWTLAEAVATGADLRVLGNHRLGLHGDLLTDVAVTERWSGADLIDQHEDGLTPLFTTDGDRPPDEEVVEHVSGWAGSQPVWTGNAATKQRQLDSVTTILDAVNVHIRCGGRADRRTWHLVDHLAQRLVDAPFGPSSGIWEIREPRRLVSEELARWIGLDTALRLRLILRPWLRRPMWRQARDAARARVEASYNSELDMFPQSFDGPFTPDASALLACIHGLFSRRDPRGRRLALATVAALEQGSFMRRYPPAADGFKGTEATFIPASWWAVSALAAVGEIDAARRRADDMCAQLPPLLSEEWDVEQRSSLGNTPLLWSHTEAARALYNLHSARIRKFFGAPGVAAYNISRYVRIRFVRRPCS